LRSMERNAFDPWCCGVGCGVGLQGEESRTTMGQKVNQPRVSLRAVCISHKRCCDYSTVAIFVMNAVACVRLMRREIFGAPAIRRPAIWHDGTRVFLDCRLFSSQNTPPTNIPPPMRLVYTYKKCTETRTKGLGMEMTMGPRRGALFTRGGVCVLCVHTRQAAIADF
jgi:hypothetical protein